MNSTTYGAEFSALTDDEQGMVVGGDSFAQTAGWFAGYAMSCMIQAIVVNYKLVNGQPVYYAEGSGWF